VKKPYIQIYQKMEQARNEESNGISEREQDIFALVTK